jgi:branched-chain amino acid transport system ATP-binding protein
MTTPILSLSCICKRFGGVVALADVGFEVPQGEILGLMGPNGAGKTTLLNIIAGTFPPDRGRIVFNGQDITGWPAHKACKLGIARTYQIPQPFVSLPVIENLRVAAVFGRPHGHAAPGLDFNTILTMTGLHDKKNDPAGTLPTLSLKKLELARALACDPQLILLDEVAAGLTEPEIPQVLATIKAIREMGKTIIIVEHVMKVLMNAVDRLIVLDKGSMLCTGSTEEVINDCQVVESYFGT